MSEVIERNGYLEFQDKDNNVERLYPVTKYENIENIPNANSDIAAPVKLYDGTGENVDGALSQKATTEKLTKVQAVLQLLAANSYIIDDIDGKTYKIISENGKLNLTESDVSPKEIADMLITAAGNLVEPDPEPEQPDQTE